VYKTSFGSSSSELGQLILLGLEISPRGRLESAGYDPGDDQGMKQLLKSGGYQWRGKSISRLEALSDAVFALAITLLLISVDSPSSLKQVITHLKYFLPFFCTFLMLFMFWDTQNLFFRWYGYEDAYTKWVNALLLFAVLFFVFPLKYLFSTAVALGFAMFGSGAYLDLEFSFGDFQVILIVFGVGLSVVFSLFGLLFLRAYRKRREIGLSETEAIDTLNHVRKSFLVIPVAAASCTIILVLGPTVLSWLSGLVYLVLIPISAAMDAMARRKKRRLAEEETAE
jgi:uncharacterized membrane protein